MSRVVPRNRSPLIDFYKVHVPTWIENAAELGLDPQDLAALQADIAAAEEALRVQQRALAMARAKSEFLRFKIKAMRRRGAGIIDQIRGRAATLGNQAYILAMIPVPEKGSPIAEPGTPYGFTTRLTSCGELFLRWECDNPRGSRGTVYHLHRQVTTADWKTGEFEFLGVAGHKGYVDSTLPPGARKLTYRVQAFRSTKMGQTADFSMNLSTDVPGPLPSNMQLGPRRDARMNRAA